MNSDNPQKLVVYQAPNGAIELRGDADAETIWATQKQMAEIFNVTPQNITIHLKNVFGSGELEQESTCKDSLQVQREGGRDIKRMVKVYNLDVLISVAYRIDSSVGTNFRKWATQTLKQHITRGYTINQRLLSQKKDLYIEVIDYLKTFTINGSLVATDDILDIIKSFSETWFSLQSYDEGVIPNREFTKRDLILSSDELYRDIQIFKFELVTKGEATDIFAQEKSSDSLKGILGNVMQSISGNDVYGTLEEKAAHLLYFIIKNHPFNDGNKRTGAFAFLWFLKKSELDVSISITPNTLTALALLVAQSNPSDKDRVIGLILLMFQER